MGLKIQYLNPRSKKKSLKVGVHKLHKEEW